MADQDSVLSPEQIKVILPRLVEAASGKAPIEYLAKKDPEVEVYKDSEIGRSTNGFLVEVREHALDRKRFHYKTDGTLDWSCSPCALPPPPPIPPDEENMKKYAKAAAEFNSRARTPSAAEGAEIINSMNELLKTAESNQIQKK